MEGESGLSPIGEWVQPFISRYPPMSFDIQRDKISAPTSQSIVQGENQPALAENLNQPQVEQGGDRCRGWDGQ